MAEEKEIDQTTDRSAEVRDMLDNIIAGNNADAQQNFNDQMASRTGEAIDQLKQDNANSVYNTHTVDPNMEPQGVGLDDALVDIDQETGRPVEDGETDGESV